MEAKRISLDDYVLTGGGFNGESYDHKTDPTVMLKLYLPGKIRQPLDEMLLARKVYDMGIPTPEPGEYVQTEDGRFGIRFHRIVGKKSYSRATGDNPEEVARYAGEFAQMCLQLHATHVDTTKFENVKDRYLRLLSESPFFTTGEKDRLGKFITDTPDEDTAVHGDLPPYSLGTRGISSTWGTSATATTSSMWGWSTSAAISAALSSSRRLSTCPSPWR